MLKRYTSEEIRRAFGVAATDKRSDEELLDLIYDAAVGSSYFNIVVTSVFNILKTAGVGAVFIAVYELCKEKIKQCIDISDDAIYFPVGASVFLVNAINTQVMLIQQQNQKQQQYDGLNKLFRSRSPSKGKRHQSTKPRK